jgi:hypothetical protein
MGRWDVFRDDEGNPVTLSEAQYRAIFHALDVVDEVRAAEGCEPIGGRSGTNWYPDVVKSRLLGRMLMDGRPPLDEKPPKWSAACGYHVVEADLPHFYLNGMTAAQWEKHATDVAEEFVRRHPGSSQKNIRVIPK